MNPAVKIKFDPFSTFVIKSAPRPVLTKKELIIYPESDGKPMAENTKQYNCIVRIKENLEIFFTDDVFIAADLFWYPVEGNNKIRRAPDVMVAIGRPKGHRGSYLQWEENDTPPQVVFEILSPGNTDSEMKKKFKFYNKYGTLEYYIYDPDKLILKGYRRGVSGLLEEIPKMNGWISPNLEIKFEMDEKNGLKMFGPNGEPFRKIMDIEKEREKEKLRADKEKAEKEKLLVDKEEIEKEKENLLVDKEKIEKEKESLRIDKEKAEAEKEKERIRADNAEKKLILLMEKLKNSGISI